VGGATTNHGFGEVYPSGGNGGADGQVVFVGFEFHLRRKHHDDYAGLDVKGKIVLIAPAARNVPGIDHPSSETMSPAPKPRRLTAQLAFRAATTAICRSHAKQGLPKPDSARESVRLAKSVEAGCLA